MRDFISMGVAGAHGKTSTTGMLSHVLSHITDTSYLVEMVQFWKCQVFCLRIRRVRTSFYAISPRVLYYEYRLWPSWLFHKQDVFNAFNDYAKQMPKVCLSTSSAELRKITANAPIYWPRFWINNDFVAGDLLRSATGSTFTVHFRGQGLGQFPFNGRHNIMNATAVIGLLYLLDLTWI